MATPSDRFRFENLTPDQVSTVRSYMSDMGLNPQFAMNPDTFNTLPIDKRQALFAQLPRMEPDAATPDVTVTRIGNRRFEEEPSALDKASVVATAPALALTAQAAPTPDLPPSLAPIVTPGTESLMGVIFDPLREETPPLPASLIPVGPTVGEKAGQVGLGLAEGGLRYATPAIAAGAAFTATAPYAAMVPVPQAYVIPIIAAAGAYGGTYLLGDTLADFFPAPPREELVPYREGAITAGGIVGAAPASLLVRAPSSVFVGNNVGSRIYKLINYTPEFARRDPKT